MATRRMPAGPVIGWREWVTLPDLAVPRIKVKVDTGARSSSLHAFDLVWEERGDESWVRFNVHPRQRKRRPAITAEARVVDRRVVRNPGGRTETRPVIVTMVAWGGHEWPVELNLTSRDEMGFRMLLGRQAVRGRFVVDPGRSFLGGRPAKDPPA
jgi:hypothetical protein